jgi:hypothetical protein
VNDPIQFLHPVPIARQKPKVVSAEKPAFVEKRQSKHKRHFDELDEDSQLTNVEDYFQVNVFYTMLDIINIQMKQRCAAMLSIIEKFAV